MPAPSAQSTRPASQSGTRHDPGGCVLELLRRTSRSEHEAATGRWVGERLATLLGFRYAGLYSPENAVCGPIYLIPDRTLLVDEARALGIATARDLLGGVVPHDFVGTKAITHPLLDDARAIPPGWSHGLARAIADVTLPGWSAFDLDDAAQAGRALLAQGLPVRIKPGDVMGGHGQSVAKNEKELDVAIAGLDRAAIGRAGVVLELNLKPVKTYSVGVLEVGPHRMAYFGTQRLVQNHEGAAVYGGSSLACLRGGLDELTHALSEEAERRVLQCAMRYDEEVQRAYPQVFASRRNYDVALGVDPSGMPRCGVLEQSWRIGGATPAELLALEAMHLDNRLQRIQVSTHEVYDIVDPPLGAQVSFRGDDPAAGRMTKYAIVDTQDDPHGR
ncbi:DUF3182 family protein [Lysobacter sp.]|uniref:DUF3182 family protein n=1 Tax=Lysobacter sp. TaxID=72226 RepID=UPI002D4C968B|nr:DUF3182 family protein [Lysobacter sp.]HZX75791.1 DUF3182 family protein [Lysobacter sp.]